MNREVRKDEMGSTNSSSRMNREVRKDEMGSTNSSSRMKWELRKGSHGKYEFTSEDQSGSVPDPRVPPHIHPNTRTPPSRPHNPTLSTNAALTPAPPHHHPEIWLDWAGVTSVALTSLTWCWRCWLGLAGLAAGCLGRLGEAGLALAAILGGLELLCLVQGLLRACVD